MALQSRISSQADRDGITELMRRAFGPELSPIAINAGFQRWKYWDAHPFAARGRSYVLDSHEGVVGHACRWPMRILTTNGSFDAFHLIDWAADSSHAGAGLQVLLDCCEDSAGMFSMGGSPTTRRMLPALGQHLRRRANRAQAMSYEVGGKVYFMSRPLKAVASALQESPLGWRTPVRVAKNALLCVHPIPRLPVGSSFALVSLSEIPEQLWPRPSSELAITARSQKLLQHFENSPVLQKPLCFVLSCHGRPVAYFFLVVAGTQVRLADYGPAGLDEATARNLGVAAQLAAKQHYSDASRIAAATSELQVQSGLLDSGFRATYEEEIRGLIVEPELTAVKQYRVTYLDLDALCL